MRKPRELKDNTIYHVIARVNRNEFILHSDKIKDMFLIIVRRAMRKYSFVIKNFCVMESHFHFIIKPLKKASLSKIMQWILSVFAIKYNRMFHITGHVWYDRFFSKIIRTMRQFVNTIIYVLLNPVRAGICKNALEYAYSGLSYGRFGIIGIMERPPTRLLKLILRIIEK